MKNSYSPKKTSSLSSWLSYITKINNKPIDMELKRSLYVAKRLNLLHPAPTVITVGGTNGKGSTCHLLETILLNSGIKVGFYNSPHLIRYTERIRIQGKELSEYDHSKAMSVIEEGRKNISLTYFEFSTLTALYLFKKAILDVVILEVGLGGRLDATNIVDTDIAVITSIALDHTDWLGSDLSNITKEKAGIFRPGKLAIIGETDMLSNIAIIAADKKAKLYAQNQNWWWENNGKYWNWWDKEKKITFLPKTNIHLNNAATALAVIKKLPFIITEKNIRQSLIKNSLPGRFQCIQQSPKIILDVAHNPHAAKYLSYRLASLRCTGKMRAIVGMLIDKDISGTLDCLCKQIDIWYCASLKNPRTASAKELTLHLINEKNIYQFNNIKDAWHKAISDALPEDCIIVFGSFYAVAPIIKLIKMEKIITTESKNT